MDKLFGKVYRVVENPHEKDAAIEIIENHLHKGFSIFDKLNLL